MDRTLSTLITINYDAAVDAGTGRWLSSAEAAARLEVKPQTLYAYVSRGLLASHPVAGRRASRFRTADVERLAARSRAGGRGGALEVLVDSSLTLLDPEGRLYFRGRDAADLARSTSYEAAAEWLWSAAAAPRTPWRATPEAVGAGAEAQAALPRWASPVDRMRVIAAAAAVTDPLRHDRRPEAVAATGRSLVAALVDCLPRVAPAGADGRLRIDGRVMSHSIAARLWPKLSVRRSRRGELEVLNAAMVLLADHELAASTLAARVAASAWADPYLVVQTGLGVAGGVLHGASSEAVREVLRRVEDGEPAARVVGDLLRAGEDVPGLGHRVYRGPDPRAAALLDMIATTFSGARSWQAATELLRLVAERAMPPPNVDFALAVLANATAMVPGGSEAVFALARCAGWVAHAIEEYPHRLRFRPRTVYTGPPPGSA